MVSRKIATHHDPRFADLTEVYTGGDGKRRYRMAVRSGSSHAPSYRYDVNGDGSAPCCECRTRHPYARSCRLEGPALALEMAERAADQAAGLPVLRAF